MSYVYSNQRVPYSWPHRWNGVPVFHLSGSSHLWTRCGKVVSGPTWAGINDYNMPDESTMCDDCLSGKEQ